MLVCGNAVTLPESSAGRMRTKCVRSYSGGARAPAVRVGKPGWLRYFELGNLNAGHAQEAMDVSSTWARICAIYALCSPTCTACASVTGAIRRRFRAYECAWFGSDGSARFSEELATHAVTLGPQVCAHEGGRKSVSAYEGGCGLKANLCQRK
jgi:hypothetical protein